MLLIIYRTSLKYLSIMKKFLFLLILFPLSFIACNNNEDEFKLANESISKTEDVVALEQLNDDIIALNFQYPEPVETKARWWKYILTALVDGGVCFASLHIPMLQLCPLTCAITASVCFFNWIDNKVESAPLLDKSISMTHLQNEEWVGNGSSAGTLHNTVVNNLYDKYGEDFYEVPDTVLAYRIAKEMSVLTNQDSTIIYSMLKDNFEVINECVDYCTKDVSIHDYIVFLKRKFPENSQQLTIFESILEGMQKIDPIENNGEYVDRVMRIIDSSDVAEPIKQTLREGLTVANASARLWNTNIIIDNE